MVTNSNELNVLERRLNICFHEKSEIILHIYKPMKTQGVLLSFVQWNPKSLRFEFKIRDTKLSYYILFWTVLLDDCKRRGEEMATWKLND